MPEEAKLAEATAVAVAMVVAEEAAVMAVAEAAVAMEVAEMAAAMAVEAEAKASEEAEAVVEAEETVVAVVDPTKKPQSSLVVSLTLLTTLA